MKLRYNFIAVFFFIVGFVKAQNVVPAVLNNYPEYVVLKVTDMVNAANIAPSEQVPLADFFVNEASSISNAMANNYTSAQLAVLQTQLIQQFQSLISPQELSLFSANRKDSIYAIPPAITTSN